MLGGRESSVLIQPPKRVDSETLCLMLARLSDIFAAPNRMYLRYWLPLILTLSLTSGECDLTPRYDSVVPGNVTGISCQEDHTPNMTSSRCVLLCHAALGCRAAVAVCSSSACFCTHCADIFNIDFEAVGVESHLKGRIFAEYLAFPPGRLIPIPNGLSVGQVIRVRVKLASYSTRLLLLTQENANIAFSMAFRFYSKSIVRNSYIKGWGPEERSKPHFNFSPGQEIEVLYIVKSTEYVVYINSENFFAFEHRVHDLHSIKNIQIDSMNSAGSLIHVFITD
ncbi:galectin [Plakobranchus ocellatus]|uniref:Galectin n=1 Tax=Plakobranchus ocellatus TaxID=259542 RepID=A0AAV4DRQ2_9GAST|nr:galectin [Plakobranchus ocellatus]